MAYDPWEARRRAQRLNRGGPAVSPVVESGREALVNSLSQNSPLRLGQQMPAHTRPHNTGAAPVRAVGPVGPKRGEGPPTAASPAPTRPIAASVQAFLGTRKGQIDAREAAEAQFSGALNTAAAPKNPNTGFPANWNQYHEQDLQAIGKSLGLKGKELDMARQMIGNGQDPREVIEDMLRYRRQQSDARGTRRLEQAGAMGEQAGATYTKLLQEMKLQGREQNKVLELLQQGKSEQDIRRIVEQVRQALQRVQGQLGPGAQLTATRGDRSKRDAFLGSLLSAGRP